MARIFLMPDPACGHASPLQASLSATEFVTPRPPGTAAPLVEVVAIRTVRGPAAPATMVRATGGCPSGAVLVEGGISVAPIGGGTPPPSLHVDGTHPSDSAGKPAASGARPGAWSAVGATGGQVVIGAGTTEFALCTQGVAATSQIAVAAVAGPVQTAVRPVEHTERNRAHVCDFVGRAPDGCDDEYSKSGWLLLPKKRDPLAVGRPRRTVLRARS